MKSQMNVLVELKKKAKKSEEEASKLLKQLLIISVSMEQLQVVVLLPNQVLFMRSPSIS